MRASARALAWARFGSGIAALKQAYVLSSQGEPAVPAKKTDDKAARAKPTPKAAAKTAAKTAAKAAPKAAAKSADQPKAKTPVKASAAKGDAKRAVKPAAKPAAVKRAAPAATPSPKAASSKAEAEPAPRRKPGPKPKVKPAEPAPDAASLMKDAGKDPKPARAPAAAQAAHEAFQGAAKQSGERMASGMKDMMAQTRRLLEAQSESFAPMYLLPQECARFYAQRVKANLDLMNALAACREPGDAMAVWTDAAQRALEDYQDEMRRLGEFMTPVTPGSARKPGRN